MKLELRNDEAVACPSCGVTAPILTGGFGDPLEADLSDLFERAWARREDFLARLFKEEMVSVEQLIRQEAQAAKAAVEREHEKFVSAVEALGAERASKWRWVKRRWQRGLEDEITKAVFELKEQTRRA